MNRDRVDRDRDNDRDNDRDDRPRRRLPRLEIRYTFVVKGKPAPDEVRGENFRLGIVVSTSSGPHRVVEIFWYSDYKATVLLRPVPPEKKTKKAELPYGSRRTPVPSRPKNPRSASSSPYDASGRPASSKR